MARILLYSLIVALATCGVSVAGPDEDALPPGATARLGSLKGRYRPLTAHAFVDGGRTLLTVHHGPELDYRDVASGRLLARYRLGHDEIGMTRLSADGRVLATLIKGFVTIWDVPSRHLIHAIRYRWSSCVAAPTADGSKVLILDGDEVTALDLRTGRRRLFAAVDHEEPVGLHVIGRCALVNGPNLRGFDVDTGRLLWAAPTVGDFSGVRPVGAEHFWRDDRGHRPAPLFDVATGRPSSKPADNAIAQPCCFTADARLVMCELDRPSVLNVATGKVVCELATSSVPIGFTPDGRSLIGSDAAGYLQRWDVATGRPQYANPAVTTHPDMVDWVEFSPDGRTLYSLGSSEKHIRVWDVATRRFRTALELPDDSDMQFALLPGGGKLLTVATNGSHTVHDLTSGKLLRTFPREHSNLAGGVGLWHSPDGTRLMITLQQFDERTKTFSERLRVWDTRTGELKADRSEPVRRGCIALSPDGSLMARNEYGVRETFSGRLRMHPPLDPKRAALLQFSPDGMRLAVTVSEPIDGYIEDVHEQILRPPNVELFELATRRCIAVFPRTAQVFFTARGRRVLSERELAPWLVRGPFPPGMAALSPDGTQFATAHALGSIVLWPVPPAPAVRPLAAGELDRLWADLAAYDAAAGWAAVDRLSDHPTPAITLLNERLKPTPPPDLARVRAMIADLAAEQPARRAAAKKELARQPDLIQATLREGLKATSSAEAAKSLRELLDAATQLSHPERVRRWRALAVLERIGTPEAQRLLERVAQSPTGSPETESARAALIRLAVK